MEHKDFCLLNFNPPGPCICEKVRRPYFVTMKEEASGKVVQLKFDHDWEDGSDFYWCEGNYSCDCNREFEFREASGLDRFPEKESGCSDGKYTVLKIELPDGTEVYHESSER